MEQDGNVGRSKELHAKRPELLIEMYSVDQQFISHNSVINSKNIRVISYESKTIHDTHVSRFLKCKIIGP
jgi:hypothetical protein